MKHARWFALVPFALATVALAQYAPAPTPTPGDSNPTTRSSTAAGTVLLTGTVWRYTPNQSITIRTGDGKDHDMPLQSGVRVDGSVVVGGLAALMWANDNEGKPRVMSITAPPGSAMDIEHSSPAVGSYGTGTPRPAQAAATPFGSSTTPGRTAPPARTTTPGSRDQYPSPGPSPRPTPAGPSS